MARRAFRAAVAPPAWRRQAWPGGSGTTSGVRRINRAGSECMAAVPPCEVFQAVESLQLHINQAVHMLLLQCRGMPRRPALTSSAACIQGRSLQPMF